MRKNNTTTKEIKAYGEYAEAYDNGKKFLPLAVRLEMFRKTYPTGLIEVSTPEKDAYADGLVCRCDVYSDAAKKDETHLSSSFARRVASQVQDGEIDIFAAVRAAAVSSALSLAGIELPVSEMFLDENTTSVQEEAAEEEPKPKRRRSTKDKELKITEELSEDGSPIPEETAEPEAVTEETETVPNESADDAEPEISPETADEPEATDAEVDDASETEPDVSSEEEVSADTEETESSESDEPEEESTASSEADTTPAEEQSEPEGSSVEEPASAVDEPTEDTSELDALIQETRMSYDDAINCEFAHQTRKGVYGDLLNDESSRALLMWFAKENGMFSKKNPKASKIARIIVLHDHLA